MGRVGMAGFYFTTRPPGVDQRNHSFIKQECPLVYKKRVDKNVNLTPIVFVHRQRSKELNLQKLQNTDHFPNLKSCNKISGTITKNITQYDGNHADQSRSKSKEKHGTEVNPSCHGSKHDDAHHKEMPPDVTQEGNSKTLPCITIKKISNRSRSLSWPKKANSVSFTRKYESIKNDKQATSKSDGELPPIKTKLLTKVINNDEKLSQKNEQNAHCGDTRDEASRENMKTNTSHGEFDKEESQNEKTGSAKNTTFGCSRRHQSWKPQVLITDKGVSVSNVWGEQSYRGIYHSTRSTPDLDWSKRHRSRKSHAMQDPEKSVSPEPNRNSQERKPCVATSAATMEWFNPSATRIEKSESPYQTNRNRKNFTTYDKTVGHVSEKNKEYLHRKYITNKVSVDDIKSCVSVKAIDMDNLRPKKSSSELRNTRRRRSDDHSEDSDYINEHILPTLEHYNSDGEHISEKSSFDSHPLVFMTECESSKSDPDSLCSMKETTARSWKPESKIKWWLSQNGVTDETELSIHLQKERPFITRKNRTKRALLQPLIVSPAVPGLQTSLLDSMNRMNKDGGFSFPQSGECNASQLVMNQHSPPENNHQWAIRHSTSLSLSRHLSSSCGSLVSSQFQTFRPRGKLHIQDTQKEKRCLENITCQGISATTENSIQWPWPTSSSVSRNQSNTYHSGISDYEDFYGQEYEDFRDDQTMSCIGSSFKPIKRRTLPNIFMKCSYKKQIRKEMTKCFNERFNNTSNNSGIESSHIISTSPESYNPDTLDETASFRLYNQPCIFYDDLHMNQSIQTCDNRKTYGQLNGQQKNLDFFIPTSESHTPQPLQSNLYQPEEKIEFTIDELREKRSGFGWCLADSDILRKAALDKCYEVQMEIDIARLYREIRARIRKAALSDEQCDPIELLNSFSSSYETQAIQNEGELTRSEWIYDKAIERVEATIRFELSSQDTWSSESSFMDMED